jgi:FtsP/CotA-like multicopper oxidase with cupredoxin domain
VKQFPADHQLPIPPIAQTAQDAAGRTLIRLRAAAGTTDFGQGGRADTIGLNGTYLGPTIRLRDGEQVQVAMANRLAEMTTLHWHGLHVPAKMDGGPHSMIMPGQTWRPRWRVNQPAATLWYHSHPHGQTAQQVYRGMAGMLIIDDPDAPDVGLPSDYGVDDIPLIVQDKSFTADGQLIVDPEPSSGPSTGFLGDTIVTNGRIGSFLPVTTEAVRLRVLNASNARVYNFGFSDDREFAVVASDGGLLASPVPSERIQLSPGERAEIVVRVSPGETVTLNSTTPELGTGRDSQYGGGTFDVLELRAAAQLGPSPPLADSLTTLPPADAAQAATTRLFRVQGRAINGRPMQMSRIDLAVPVDQTEIWEVRNQDRQPHNFHVHNVQFRVLSVGADPPPPVLAGYKDTVYVAPQQTVRILVRFTEYTDRNWPYMFHCHLLLHEDLGVMGQFVVVEPGQSVGTPPHADHDATTASRPPD